MASWGQTASSPGVRAGWGQVQDGALEVALDFKGLWASIPSTTLQLWLCKCSCAPWASCFTLSIPHGTALWGASALNVMEQGCCPDLAWRVGQQSLRGLSATMPLFRFSKSTLSQEVTKS